jgi:hypothetical protein
MEEGDLGDELDETASQGKGPVKKNTEAGKLTEMRGKMQKGASLGLLYFLCTLRVTGSVHKYRKQCSRVSSFRKKEWVWHTLLVILA